MLPVSSLYLDTANLHTVNRNYSRHCYCCYLLIDSVDVISDVVISGWFSNNSVKMSDCSIVQKSRLSMT